MSLSLIKWLSSWDFSGLIENYKLSSSSLSRIHWGALHFTLVCHVQHLKRDTSAKLHHKHLKLQQSNIPHTQMCILVFPKGYTTSQVVFLGQLQIITRWELVHSVKSRNWLVCCLQCVFWSVKKQKLLCGLSIMIRLDDCNSRRLAETSGPAGKTTFPSQTVSGHLCAQREHFIQYHFTRCSLLKIRCPLIPYFSSKTKAAD